MKKWTLRMEDLHTGSFKVLEFRGDEYSDVRDSFVSFLNMCGYPEKATVSGKNFLAEQFSDHLNHL